jgi:hypothetical protein
MYGPLGRSRGYTGRGKELEANSVVTKAKNIYGRRGGDISKSMLHTEMEALCGLYRLNALGWLLHIPLLYNTPTLYSDFVSTCIYSYYHINLTQTKLKAIFLRSPKNL